MGAAWYLCCDAVMGNRGGPVKELGGGLGEGGLSDVKGTSLV
jgi:hypothetical protein